MAIPEVQLETWAAIGAQITSKDTYAAVKAVLEHADAPFRSRQPRVFLQGSYGNDTNVRTESDVDIVIRMDSVFYYDISALGADDHKAFTRNHPPSEYRLQEFKAEVIQWLVANYSSDVEVGNKAVTIAARGNRRKADVLISAKHKRFYYAGFMGTDSVEGVNFLTRNGQWIVNYPQLHSTNLTTRHQATNNWLKPTARILKNMRSRATEAGILSTGVAPSYFIEGLLYNVPVHLFGKSYADTVWNCVNWLLQADKSEFRCANAQHTLLAADSAVSWHPDHCRAFLDGLAAFWNTWR